MAGRFRESVKGTLARVPPGTRPGWLPEETGPPVSLTACLYGPESFERRELRDAREIGSCLGRTPVLWVDIVGRPGFPTLHEIGARFGVHRLALEDLANLDHGTKIDHYDNHVVMITRFCTQATVRSIRNLGIAWGQDFVITVRNDRESPFALVLERLEHPGSLIRNSGPDFLAYRLLDASIDSLFPVLENLAEELDELEDGAYDALNRRFPARVHLFRNRLSVLRRHLWPQREALRALIKQPSPLVSDTTRTYLRDCSDHLEQALQEIESMRDTASGLMSTYLSAASHRLNELMSLLTMIGTVFIPLSFITGIYGMNFDPYSSPWNMPELRWRWGYPAVLALMAVI
ncbi:MAG: magnesium and cobalt transport protein CorA, partial [Acidobacteria bacterium]